MQESAERESVQSVIMLYVTFYCHADRRLIVSHYAECCYAKHCYAECHYDDAHRMLFVVVPRVIMPYVIVVSYAVCSMKKALLSGLNRIYY